MPLFSNHRPRGRRPHLVGEEPVSAPVVGDAEREVAHLSAVMAASPDLVTTVDRNGHLLYANPAANAYFGIDDEGSPDWGPPPNWAVERYQQEVQPALRATGTWSGELALGRDDE